MKPSFSIMNKNTVIRRIIFFVLIVAAALWQNSVGAVSSPSQIHIYVMPLLISAIAMNETQMASVVFAFFGGMFIDVFSPYSMGVSAVLLMICALLISLAVSHFLRSTVATNLVFTAGTLIVYSVGIWLFDYVFRGFDGIIKPLFTSFLPSVLISVIFAPIVFIIAYKIAKRFETEEN